MAKKENTIIYGEDTQVFVKGEQISNGTAHVPDTRQALSSRIGPLYNI
jgi:hypothetical protein